MEQTMRKACRAGEKAKFWERVIRLLKKMVSYSEEKVAKYRLKQTTILKSIGIEDPDKLVNKN